MPTELPTDYGDFLVACVEMVGRVGASGFELRYDDNEGEGKVVWMALTEFKRKSPLKGIKVVNTITEVAAGLTPEQAAFRLLETLVDGGQCQHCRRPTGITSDWDEMPAGKSICWYQYDPELKRFRRGCG